MSRTAAVRTTTTKKDTKRAAEEKDKGDDERVPKKPKIHSFFTNATVSSSRTDSPWQREPERPSILHFVHEEAFPPIVQILAAPPVPFHKLAIFDLDGTLIKTREGGKFPKDANDWNWWNPIVKPRLAQLNEEKYMIVIISNQNGLTPPPAKGTKKYDDWKRKLELISYQLKGVPFRAIAAMSKDYFRKPMLGMWDYLNEIFAAEGRNIDVENSFYVGDAAGRPSDHSDGDLKWAQNAGLKFHTPEQFFLNDQKTLPAPAGFNPKALPSSAFLFSPTNTPLVPTPPEQEIVIFCGPPGCGKSRFFGKYFAAAGYIRINQDELKSRPKCLRKTEETVKSGGKVVIDNTNRNVLTRELYINIAKQYKIPVRCLYFNMTKLHALHNNEYRKYPSTFGERVPQLAIHSWYEQLEEPNQSEGFSEIVKTINWQFDGSEKEKERWECWTDPK